MILNATCVEESIDLQKESELAEVRNAYERLQTEALTHVEENRQLLAQAKEVRALECFFFFKKIIDL